MKISNLKLELKIRVGWCFSKWEKPGKQCLNEYQILDQIEYPNNLDPIIRIIRYISTARTVVWFFGKSLISDFCASTDHNKVFFS